MRFLFRDIFYTYKNNKADRNFQAFVSLFIYAIAGTFIYSIIYLIFGYLTLAATIFLCFIIFVLTIMIFDKGKLNLALFMAFVGVSATVSSSVVMVGIDCGAQFYLLCAAILFLSNEYTTKVVKSLYAILSLAEYFAIYILFSESRPLFTIQSNVLLLMNQINTIASFGAVVYSSVSYRSAVKVYEKDLKTINEKANYLANFDQLTQLGNRHYTYQQLDSLIKEFNESNVKFVVAMVDIDNFKFINDHYGHLFGDEILKFVGLTMKKTLRKNDIVGRWGGEEFLIILPDLQLTKGYEILQRIKDTISATTVKHDDEETKVTVTIGGVEFEKNMPLAELIRIADSRMYLGKRRGKNCVVVEDDINNPVKPISAED